MVGLGIPVENKGVRLEWHAARLLNQVTMRWQWQGKRNAVALPWF